MTLGLVAQLAVIAFCIVQEARALGEAEELLGVGIVYWVLIDLGTVGDAGKHGGYSV